MPDKSLPDSDMIFPGLREYCSTAQLAALAAPRPLVFFVDHAGLKKMAASRTLRARPEKWP